MNSLSWLLYGINVIGNLNTAFIWFLVISIPFTIFSFLYCYLKWIERSGYNNSGPGWDHEQSKKPFYGMVFVFIFLSLSVALFPSQRTLYLMAASEIGQRVMTNEKVAGLVDPSIEVLQNYVKLENIKIRKELNKLTNKDD